MSEQPEKTPRQKYAEAQANKTELPHPASIVEHPSGNLSDHYQEARIALDRYWASLGNEILVRDPQTKRIGEYRRTA